MRVRTAAAVAAFLIPFAVYIASIAPDVGYWDTADLQTVSYIFGIAHATGFPAFIFAGWLFSHAIPFGTVAWRVGLVSAVAMAAAAYFVYATVVELEEKPVVGTFAAMFFAFGEVAWTRGSRAEAHALELGFASFAVWSLLRWRRTGRKNALYGTALAYGLALATHPVAILMAPGLVLLLFPRIVETSRRTIAAAVLCAILPGLLYLYLPLRSAYVTEHRIDPMLALGTCGREAFWDFGHPATLGGLVRYLGAGEQGSARSGLREMLSLDRYPGVITQFLDLAHSEYGAIALLLAALGLFLLERKNSFLTLGLFLACMASVPFGLVFVEADPARYLLTAFWFIAILVAVGVGRATAALFPRREDLGTFVAIAVMCALAGSRVVVNYQSIERQHGFTARVFVNRVLAGTPDNALLVANWPFATPLGYVENVEHGLGHRLVITAQATACKGSYAEWLKSRPLFLVNTTYPDTDFRAIVVAHDPTLVRIESKDARGSL